MSGPLLFSLILEYYDAVLLVVIGVRRYDNTVIKDETRAHHFTPEVKMESNTKKD